MRIFPTIAAVALAASVSLTGCAPATSHTATPAAAPAASVKLPAALTVPLAPASVPAAIKAPTFAISATPVVAPAPVKVPAAAAAPVVPAVARVIPAAQAPVARLAAVPARRVAAPLVASTPVKVSKPAPVKAKPVKAPHKPVVKPAPPVKPAPVVHDDVKFLKGAQYVKDAKAVYNLYAETILPHVNGFKGDYLGTLATWPNFNENWVPVASTDGFSIHHRPVVHIFRSYGLPCMNLPCNRG